jgi:hypothetical protein
VSAKKVCNPFKFRADTKKASLTVEAALVLPVFLFFMLSFLYFIQIFIVQEQIQASITKMGLNLAKTAYVFKDFPDIEEALSLDFTIFNDDYDIGLDELADHLVSDNLLKFYAKKYLDTDQINRSCIVDGFDGINFTDSSVLCGSDYIDIIVSYEVSIPVKTFVLGDMQMIQRVRLHNWTGYEVTPVYQTQANEDNNGAYVYISDTGRVYHKDENCSHIKLSVSSVQGVPTSLRNEYGGRYTPCEACCSGKEEEPATYYITSDGTKYHTRRDCSKIKRSIKKVKLSDVGNRTPCKRCYD